MPDDENGEFSIEAQAAGALSAALETMRRDVLNEIPDRVEQVFPDRPQSNLPRHVSETQQRLEARPAIDRPSRHPDGTLAELRPRAPRFDDAPVRDDPPRHVTSLAFTRPAPRHEFGYLTDVTVPGIGHILEAGAAAAAFQWQRWLELQVDSTKSPEVKNGKPDGLPKDDIGLIKGDQDKDFADPWRFIEGDDGDKVQRPMPGVSDRRTLACGKKLRVTATFDVVVEIKLASDKLGEGDIAAELANELNSPFEWSEQNPKNRDAWEKKIRMELCKWGKDKWASLGDQSLDSPSVPPVDTPANRSDPRDQNTLDGEGRDSKPVFPPRWIHEEIECVPWCVPHWYYLGCETSNVREHARYFSSTGMTVTLYSYVSATL